jgi:transposase
MADLFWLSDEQWAVLQPFMPQNQPGARRVDDRRVISGIVHVLKSGGRWRGLPGGLWPAHDHLQPLQQMVPARLLARHAPGPG